MAEAIVDILVRNKFLDSADKKGRGPKKFIEIKLKYENGKGVISNIKFISKPSRRIYSGYKEIKPIRHGYGISIISTPKGLVTNNEAKLEKVGGEVLFEIW
jgi:small subunit ribosomal protein S8